MSPLFGSHRDAGLLKGLNQEMMHRFISNEVVIYKIDMTATKINIYEESEQKIYSPPVRVFTSLIDVLEKSTTDDEFGLSFMREVNFGFLISDLVDANLFLEEGDIIFYDDRYYEVDMVNETNYWSGRNPDTNIGMTEDGWERHGYRHYAMAQTHLTNINKLHISDSSRIGINPHDDVNDSIPKFL